MNDEQILTVGYVISAVLLILCMIAFYWWSAGQEASAYFRATGKVVSQWDAMFLELRVQGS